MGDGERRGMRGGAACKRRDGWRSRRPVIAGRWHSVVCPRDVLRTLQLRYIDARVVHFSYTHC